MSCCTCGYKSIRFLLYKLRLVFLECQFLVKLELSSLLYVCVESYFNEKRREEYEKWKASKCNVAGL